MTTHEAGPAPIEEFDVIGVGFGPSNMALAAALDDAGFHGGVRRGSRRPTALFLEASAETMWHPGMLFDGASLQVSFAKDLVSFRNPTSPLSFMNFLVEQGRVHDFFNRGSMAPLRVEFTAYLRWAAERLADWVRFGERVETVEPRFAQGVIVGYDVRSRSAAGEVVVRRARHVVLAAGLQPRVPEGFPDDVRAFHSGRYLRDIENISDVSTAVVVGGGQSAAEVALETHRRFPQAQVHLVHSRFGLIPSDATPFANRIFDNPSVDSLFGAPAAVRARLDAVHANTNNSVVHENTLQELYDTWYVGSWTEQRLHFHDVSRVTQFAAAGTQQPIDVEVSHELDGTQEIIPADLVVAATGYRPLDPGVLLGDDADLLQRDECGRICAGRDYALQWQAQADGQLFTIGTSQHLHGVSATLLSNIALRAGEIVAAITGASPGGHSAANRATALTAASGSSR